MIPTNTDLVNLIQEEVNDSERLVRHYGYLALHLKQVHQSLQYFTAISACSAVLTLLIQFYIHASIYGLVAFASLLVTLLRANSIRSERCASICRQLAQLHLDLEHLLLTARNSPDNDLMIQWKALCNNQIIILEYVPLDLTLSPRLSRKAQQSPHRYWSRSFQSATRSTSPDTTPAQSH